VLRALILGVSAALAAGCVPPSVGAAILVDPVRTPVVDTTSLPHRPFTFTSGDVELQGWFFEPAAKPRGLVVFLHGRMANRSWGIGAAEALVPRGYAVLAYDQRAHGTSGGAYCTYGHLEKGDLSRAIDAAGVAPVYVIGHSLGAAVALQAAAEDPRIRAVVAAAPFSDLRTIVNDRAPILESAADLRAAIEIAERKAGFDVDTVSPVTSAARIQVPVLLLHGTRDTTIRPIHSARIMEALAGPKRRIVVDGANHYDVLRYPAVWAEITRWLDAQGG
jgi:alpha-beta hydrolase superfamily lysophospholipase